MQIVNDFLYEILVAWVLVDFLQVVFSEHAGDLPAAEEVVDVFQEGLVDHMVLGEDEANRVVLEGS